MEQHPVPRQITTFEFKLVGFFTIKQFIYMVTFVPLGFIVYSIFPIPILNILLGLGVGAIGFALALMPINDRPADVWVKNLYKRLTSPTQYTYHKENPPVYFFQDLYFLSNPHLVMTHVESKEKLAAYMARSQKPLHADPHKQRVKAMLKNPHSVQQIQGSPGGIATHVQATHVPQASNSLKPVAQSAQQAPSPQPSAVVQPAKPSSAPVTVKNKPVQQVVVIQSPAPIQQPKSVSIPATPQPVTSPKEPFFTGVIKNHKLIPIPGILIYVKDDKGTPLRLLKSNPHGIFATFNSLPPGEYFFQPKDPRNTYNFDTMKIKVEQHNAKPYEIFSKEML